MEEQAIDLPPLPALEAMTERVEVWALMQAYARAAVLADRARNALPAHWSVPVTDLGLGIRTQNCLLADDILTVGEIYKKRGGVLHISGVGRFQAAEINEALVSRGWPAVYEPAKSKRSGGLVS